MNSSNISPRAGLKPAEPKTNSYTACTSHAARSWIFDFVVRKEASPAHKQPICMYATMLPVGQCMKVVTPC